LTRFGLADMLPRLVVTTRKIQAW